MISKALETALQNIGFSVGTDNAFGIYGNYLITIFENGNKKTAFINFLIDDKDDSSLTSFDISEEIKGNLDNYSIIDYELVDDGLLITTAQSVPDFLKLMDFCIELLNSHNVKGSDFCSGCGKEFGKRYPKKISKDNKNYLMCENCAIDIIEDRDKKSKQEKEKIPANRLVSGVIGALIGGIIGFFLFFAVNKWLLPLIPDFNSFILKFGISCLGFITAFLVYYGYKLFCEKPSKNAYFSVSIISILVTAFGHYFGTLIYIANEHSLKLRDFFTYELWKMPFRSTSSAGTLEYSSDFYLYGTIAIILAASGAIIFLLGFYEKNRIIKDEIKIETLKIEK